MKEHFLISRFAFLCPLSPPPVFFSFLFPLLMILIFPSHAFQGAFQLLFYSGAVLCKQQPGWSKIVKFMWFIYDLTSFLHQYSSSEINMIKMDSCSLRTFLFGLIQYIDIHYICWVLWHQGQWNDLQNSLLYSQGVSTYVLKPFGHANLISSTAVIDSFYLA